jgi:hypothetical protein
MLLMSMAHITTLTVSNQFTVLAFNLLPSVYLVQAYHRFGNSSFTKINMNIDNNKH